MPENAEVGYTVAHVAATDADWGTNSDLHYYLLPDQVDFTIDADSGALASTNVLDHERQVAYAFQACAADRGTPNVRTACVSDAHLWVLCIDLACDAHFTTEACI